MLSGVRRVLLLLRVNYLLSHLRRELGGGGLVYVVVDGADGHRPHIKLMLAIS